MVKNKEKEFSFGHSTKIKNNKNNMKVNSIIIFLMVMEYINGVMEKSMKEDGKKVKDTGMEDIKE